MSNQHQRNLNDFGYKIFLDRYALKDLGKTNISIGDTVLASVNGQKEIGTVRAVDGNTAMIQLCDDEAKIAFDLTGLDKPIELDPAEMWHRVANDIANAEESVILVDQWQDKFYWLLEDWKFIPGGRILAGAGTDSDKTYYNCFVIPSPKDSKEGIFETANLMSQIMSRGGGVGINISSLRPKYSRTQSTDGRSSGAVSWGEMYSFTTGLIEQGGSRRGALMLVLDDWHPDLMEFIQCKKDMSRITNANISIAISDTFMEFLENDDQEWTFQFPDTTDPSYDEKWDGNLAAWEGKIDTYGSMPAREIWDALVESAWASGEPGIWFKDTANRFSNSHYYAPLICVNPCGEVPLPEWGVCCLGSINLSKFVYDANAVDWDSLRDVVYYAVRFLDNVIDRSPHFHDKIANRQQDERRIGLGTMGLAEMLIKLKVRYGSNECLEFLSELYGFIRDEAYLASSQLAEEKGSFPKFDLEKFIGGEFVGNLPQSVRHQIMSYGLRNVTLLTQAPAGTIGTMVGTSTGIEPFYFWEYERKGRLGSHTERVKVYEDWNKKHDLLNLNTEKVTILPDHFVTAQELTSEEHVEVQATIQRYVDSSISKTCNLPIDYTVKQVSKLYALMHELDCKGGTIYRDGSRDEQVLNLKETKPKIEDIPTWQVRLNPLLGMTYRKQTPIGTAYITINSDFERRPFEVFVNIGKAGSDVAAHAESLGRLISLILRVPSHVGYIEMIERIVTQLKDIGSSRSLGFGKDRVKSLEDAVAQVLEEHCLLFSIDESAKLPQQPDNSNLTGDLCPKCGNTSLISSEGCITCFGCGYSEC